MEAVGALSRVIEYNTLNLVGLELMVGRKLIMKLLGCVVNSRLLTIWGPYHIKVGGCNILYLQYPTVPGNISTGVYYGGNQRTATGPGSDSFVQCLVTICITVNYY